ncbi:MAG: DUF4406 domain-containing protein [Treponema sp.]|jgi:hypothetical protein|nr:DUF4406 domain-containing protein [Treponema sp.]
MKHIYLCGPVTGQKRQEAANHFAAVEKKIRDGVSEPVFTSNPMRFCPPELDWYGAMKTCVGEMVRCHGIALLQGWQRSKGATLELKLAQDLQIPVVYIEPPLDYLDLSELFTAAPETLRYYNARLTQFHNEGVEESLAENRAIVELTHRYLDPYGFEYIENSQEG